MTSLDLHLLLPSLLLVVFAIGSLGLAALRPRAEITKPTTLILAGVFAAMALWIGTSRGEANAFGGLVRSDAFARYMQVAMLLSGAAVLVAASEVLTRRGADRVQFPGLVALSMAGMLLMAGAGDLMVLYLGSEMQGMAMLALVAMNRRGSKSAEAGLKAGLYGLMVSAVLLFGLSLLYGATGSTRLTDMAQALHSDEAGAIFLIGLALTLGGFGARLALVPFHMRRADLQEGAPAPVSALLGTAGMLASFAALARLLFDGMGEASQVWGPILGLLAIASLAVGGFGALEQRNIRRVFGYGAIGHMGFAMVGLATGSEEGLVASLIYLSVVTLASIGTDAFVMAMERLGRQVTDVASLSQFASADPTRALALTGLLMAHGGLPPVVGVLARILVLMAAFEAGLIWLALAAGLLSVMAMLPVLRMIWLMYFGAEESEIEASMGLGGWLVMIGAALIVTLGAFGLWGLDGIAAQAAAPFFN